MELATQIKTINGTLLWDPGANRFLKKPDALDGNPYEPNFRIPTWWRRFIFSVLSPREFVTYCSIVAHCDRYGRALLTTKKLREYSGLTDNRRVNESIKRLVELGFLLRQEIEKSTLFQRPALQFTLIRLLQEKQINSALLPLNGTIDKSPAALKSALQGLCGINFTRDYMKMIRENAVGEDDRAQHLIDKLTKDQISNANLLAEYYKAESLKAVARSRKAMNKHTGAASLDQTEN